MPDGGDAMAVYSIFVADANAAGTAWDVTGAGEAVTGAGEAVMGAGEAVSGAGETVSGAGGAEVVTVGEGVSLALTAVSPRLVLELPLHRSLLPLSWLMLPWLLPSPPRLRRYCCCMRQLALF